MIMIYAPWYRSGHCYRPNYGVNPKPNISVHLDGFDTGATALCSSDALLAEFCGGLPVSFNTMMPDDWHLLFRVVRHAGMNSAVQCWHQPHGCQRRVHQVRLRVDSAHDASQRHISRSSKSSSLSSSSKCKSP
jgi:hypothetical protein